MDENILLKIALVCSIVGVIALYIISGRIDVDETLISKITSGSADGEVLVKGKVSRVTEKNNILVIEIEKKETIPVFVMKDSNLIDVKQDDIVEVRGSVQDYRGKKEIIADEIRSLG